jgi:hypothetical protein
MITLTRQRLALATLTAVAAAALPAAAQAAPIVAPHTSGDDLYVATAGGGSLTPTGHGGDTYRLELDHPGQAITAFADHPGRVAGDVTPQALVRDWKADGFAADPPNAALVVDGAPTDHDVMVVELTHPELAKSGALVFDAKRVPAPKDGALAAFAPRADRSVASRFGGASLFVDDGATSVPITLTATLPARATMVVNPTSGDLTLSPKPNQAALNATGPVQSRVVGGAIVLMSGADPTTVTETIGVTNGGGPIALSTSYTGGASATVSVNGGAAQPLPAGAASIPVS